MTSDAPQGPHKSVSFFFLSKQAVSQSHTRVCTTSSCRQEAKKGREEERDSVLAMGQRLWLRLKD